MAGISGKRVALLIAQEFQDQEAFYPLYRLREEGAHVTVLGAEQGQTYKGKLGWSLKADRSIRETAADEFDAVVIPGGWAPDFMRREPAFKAFTRAAIEKNLVVAAICHAGWLLASTKLIAGRRLTSFHAIRDDLEHAGAEWVDAEVVVDKNLVTSRVPDDLPAFLRAIIGRLAER